MSSLQIQEEIEQLALEEEEEYLELEIVPELEFSGQPEVLIDTGRSKFWVIRDFGPDLYPFLQDLDLDVEPALGRNFGNGPAYMRRDVGFFSDTSIGYRYSGQISKSRPLASVPIFPELLEKINQFLGVEFNGILVNRYQNGEKYVGAHADEESNLDKTRKMVAGLVYGPATRIFRIRTGRNQPVVLDFPHGSRTLIVMEGDFQREFVHEIPIQKSVKDKRTSLTLRHHTK